MLHSEKRLEEVLGTLLYEKTMSHTAVLLMHCRERLLEFSTRDQRLERRLVLLEDQRMPLPQIFLLRDEEAAKARRHFFGIKQLLEGLEQPSDGGELYVTTGKPISLFCHSVYAVKEGPDVYEGLCENSSDIAEGTCRKFGSEEQWRWLRGKFKGKESFSQLVTEIFHSFDSLDLRMGEVLRQGTEEEKWLFWLSVKIRKTHNRYFNQAVAATSEYRELERAMYFALLDMDCNASDFLSMYRSRKSILRSLPENIRLISEYCTETGRKERDALRFLTDLTEQEQFTLVQCLSHYDYSRETLAEVLPVVSPELHRYMGRFIFSPENTGAKDVSLSAWLTDYFEAYKWQKLTNRVEENFLTKVEESANTRPYNRLLSRAMVIKNLNCRDAQPYFVDALGVEYLAYIREKCKELGLMADIHIGYGELPSITEINKEFLSVFSSQYVDIKELDELKHDDTRFNYEKVKEPIHIIRELAVISRVLDRIHSDLSQGTDKMAVMVSDHGASRLAVIHGAENASTIEMPEKGKHSGRCCKIDHDPDFPFAAYENGYAVLANYERFRGGRKADVEVHGGATLEEVLVPIIRLFLRPEKVSYSFVDTVIHAKANKEIALRLFCNIPMEKPRLFIQGKFYEGTFTAPTRQHAKFVLQDVRRKGSYVAEIYEGESATGMKLSFEIKKQTREIDFGL